MSRTNMYIYDPKLSGVQTSSARDSIRSQYEFGKPLFYPDPGMSASGKWVGNGGSYVLENDGLGTLSAVEPFADQAYGPQMISDRNRTNDLIEAIRNVKRTLSLTDQQRLDRVAFTIARLDTKENPVKYAGVKENQMLFSASLLKVALLYASFELRSRLNKLAPTVVFDWKPFLASVASAVPSIPNGDWKEMKVNEIMVRTASDSGVLSFDLRRRHRHELSAIFADQRQDWAARACMHRLGYSYVNGALAAAGFLDLNTKKGIWYANDLGGGWQQFHVPVDTKGKSSAAMTAIAMANLLTAMHRGTLIDQKSSREMMEIMSRGSAFLTIPEVAAKAGSLTITTKGAKVGHHPSADAKVSSVKSEGVFVQRRGVPFVVVWQNYPDADPDDVSDTINIYRVIDEVVTKWP